MYYSNKSKNFGSARAAALLSSLLAKDVYYTGKRALTGAFAGKKKKISRRSYAPPRNTYNMRTSYIGRPIGQGTSKRSLVDNIAGRILDSRTLYSVDLTAIFHANTGNSIRRRQRDLIDVKGFKICQNVQNLGALNLSPLMFHWAVVHDKGRAEAALSVIDPIQTGDFFRGNGQNRGIDFDTSLSSAEFNNLDINNDLYVVLKRGVGKLAIQNTGQNLDLATNYGYNTWVPLNRQIRYDNETNETNEEFPVDGRVFLVYWCEAAEGEPGTSTVTPSVASLDSFCVTYWKEPL